jgi:hypothetical protein
LAPYAAQQRSGGRPYAQAFLGAELLIDAHGTAALPRTARFATGTERRQALADSFGMDLASFESVPQQRWHQAILPRPSTLCRASCSMLQRLADAYLPSPSRRQLSRQASPRPD